MTTTNTGLNLTAMRNAYINQYSSKQNTVGKVGICMLLLKIVNFENVDRKAENDLHVCSALIFCIF
jgi:hypothetical protein